MPTALCDKPRCSLVVSDKPKDPPAVSDKPKDQRAMSEKTKDTIAASDTPNYLPGVSNKPRCSLAVSDKPSDLPAVSDKPKDSPAVSDKPKDPPRTQNKISSARFLFTHTVILFWRMYKSHQIGREGRALVSGSSFKQDPDSATQTLLTQDISSLQTTLGNECSLSSC